jgi:hypothetical protein
MHISYKREITDTFELNIGDVIEFKYSITAAGTIRKSHVLYISENGKQFVYQNENSIAIASTSDIISVNGKTVER